MARLNRSIPGRVRLYGPVVVDPPAPPTLRQLTLDIHTAVLRERAERRRRRGKILLPVYIPYYLYIDEPTGSAAPSGTLSERWQSDLVAAAVIVTLSGRATHTHVLHVQPAAVSLVGLSYSEVVAGSAGATGSLAAEQKTGSDAVTGAAAPSGSVVEHLLSGAVVQRETVRMAVSLRSRHGAILSPAIVLAAAGQTFIDYVGGTSAATGSVVETYDSPLKLIPSVVRLAARDSVRARWKRRVMAILFAPAIVAPPTLPLPEQRLLRVKLAGRNRVELRRRAPHSLLRRPAKIAGGDIFTDSVTGSASPSGTLLEQKTYADHPSGAAAATGSCSDSYQQGSNYNDQPFGQSAASGTRVEAQFYIDHLFGASAASGTVFEADVPYGHSAASGHTSESFVVVVFVTGTAAPSGFVIEELIPGYGDVTVSFTTLGFRRRWAVTPRV